MIDLHSHSTASDGTHSPSQLMSLAKDRGICTLALTDHDTLSGLKEARQKADELGICLIDGVEISCHHALSGGYGKQAMTTKTIHVVALNFKDEQRLTKALHALQHSREIRGRQMVERLATLLNCDKDALLEAVLTKVNQNPKAIGRAHIAQVLYDFGFVKSIQEAFDKYLADNKPAYVPIQTMTMNETIHLIEACGGISVLAHPTRYGLSATRIRRLIADFADAGGHAIELPNSEPVSTRAMIDRCIEAHGLMVSVGSDFHGQNMPWRKLGYVATPKAEQVGVWTRFV